MRAALTLALSQRERGHNLTLILALSRPTDHADHGFAAVPDGTRRCPERGQNIKCSLLKLWHTIIIMGDYFNLTRPKIVAMVLAAMLVSGWTAGESGQSKSRAVPAWKWIELFNAMVGTAGVIMGAIALNQRLECQGDAKMPRTANRPLPSGRLTARRRHGSAGLHLCWARRI